MKNQRKLDSATRGGATCIATTLLISLTACDSKSPYTTNAATDSPANSAIAPTDMAAISEAAGLRTEKLDPNQPSAEAFTRIIEGAPSSLNCVLNRGWGHFSSLNIKYGLNPYTHEGSAEQLMIQQGIWDLDGESAVINKDFKKYFKLIPMKFRNADTLGLCAGDVKVQNLKFTIPSSGADIISSKVKFTWSVENIPSKIKPVFDDLQSGKITYRSFEAPPVNEEIEIRMVLTNLGWEPEGLDKEWR